ncbi:MAG: hypothetical protein O2960_25975 [Verrucomicrobia bacterium]|nr:hypothetical protein [Verrucomicrobiota bacterium]
MSALRCPRSVVAHLRRPARCQGGEFNPRYAEAEDALLEKFRHLHTDIYGNREFVEHLRNRGKFFDHQEPSRTFPK